MSNKIKALLVVLLVIFAGAAIGVGLYLVNQQTNIESDASGATVLYFSDPDPVGPQSVDEEFTVDVLVNTNGDTISGVDANISFDPQYLEVVSIEQGSNRFSSYPEMVKDNSAGTINISANVGGTGIAVSGESVRVATITFNPLQPITSTPVTFNFSLDNLAGDSNVPAFVASGQEPNDLLSSVSNLSVEIEDDGTSTIPVSMEMVNLFPSNPQTVGAGFNYDIVVNTRDNMVDGVDAKLTFDADLLQVTQISRPEFPTFSNYLVEDSDNELGTITISANVGSGSSAEPVTGDAIVLATVTMVPTEIGSTIISFNFTPDNLIDSNVVQTINSGQEASDLLETTNTLSITAQAPVNDGNDDDNGDDTDPNGGGDDNNGGGTGGVTPTATPTPTVTPLVTSTPVPTVTPLISPTPITDNTVDGTEPLPEELPNTASPIQALGQLLIAISLVSSGLLFKFGFKEEN